MLEFRDVLSGEQRLVVLARELFEEYESELGEDLCFQGFSEELEHLPGKYAPPAGALLIGFVGPEAVGCVALRPIESPGMRACEMKRLYIRPAYRGHGYGREFAEEIIARGSDLGYDEMVLDTLDRLVPALVLYRSLGFKECAPYYGNPLSGVVYLRKPLQTKQERLQ
jgi:putative acetyltransferase